MVLFFTTILVLSCVGLLSLIVTKRWELSTGHMVGAGIRPYVDRVSQKVLLWVLHIFPTLGRLYIKLLWRESLRYAHKVSALAVLHFERSLEKTLHHVRYKTDVRGGAPASAFLREVSEHKRKLLHARDNTDIRKE